MFFKPLTMKRQYTKILISFPRLLAHSSNRPTFSRSHTLTVSNAIGKSLPYPFQGKGLKVRRNSPKRMQEEDGREMG